MPIKSTIILTDCLVSLIKSACLIRLYYAFYVIILETIGQHIPCW